MRTGLIVSGVACSSSLTAVPKCFEMELATSAASCGDDSSTVTSMSTVPMGAVEFTWSARARGVVSSRPSSRMTGVRTFGLSRTLVYDWTRCWVNMLPCMSRAALPVSYIDTNSRQSAR